MFAWCRSKPITSIQYLNHQTRHARREDDSSKPRIRADATPGKALSWSCDDGPKPDYAASFRTFKKSRGAGERKGAQLGLHMLVGVSSEWVREAGGLHDPENPRNRQLLEAARTWADGWSNGGCYAARLDLDETGGAVVDLMIAPTAEQKHKSGKSKLTVSVNKALEAVSLAHTGKKSKHYSALNTSWAEFALANLDPRLQRGRPKAETGAEHVGPDQYRTMMLEAEAARAAAKKAEAEARAKQREMDRQLELVRREREELEEKVQEGARVAAEAVSAVVTGDLYMEGGRWKARKGAPDPERLKPFWAAIQPAMRRVASWWDRIRGRVQALPDPEEFRASLAIDAPEDAAPSLGH
jgi:hypothetical protein